MKTLALIAFLAAGCLPPLIQVTPTRTTTTGAMPEYVELGDLNGDGKIDLVLSRALPRSELVIYEGDGSGGFVEHAILTGTGAKENRIAIADIDGDGKADIIAAGFNAAHITVLRGRGDFTFHPTQTQPVGYGNGKPFLADVDGDGKLDVIMALARLIESAPTAQREGRVAVLHGRGDGTFDPPTVTPVGAAAHGIVVGDFNHDGRADVIVGDEILHREVVLLGCADGRLAWHSEIPSRFGVGAGVVGDFNHDGHLDVGLGGGGINIYLGRGDGTFEDAGTIGGEPGQHVRAADFDGDGNIDIVTQHFVFAGNGRGGFTQYRMDQRDYEGASSVTVGDVNGDGRSDLLLVDHSHNQIRVYADLFAHLVAMRAARNSR